ncbi:MAG TPA: DUF1573 domain-containing protein [Bacteroidia bacterium]|nr:DUF1573 domain-containing protein [Bacteroidia bacterium]HNS12609.1 DUF1573 domain-containing protein [Bacteroidia bacterium]
MRNKVLLILMLASFSLVATAQNTDKKVLSNVGNENSNQAEFSFKSDEFDFGTIKQGESSTHEFVFTNTGNEPLIISKAEGSCGCTVPVYPKEPIMKGQSATVKVTFNSAGKMGVQDKTVTITSNAKQNPMVLHMKGIVEKPADPATSPGTDSKK